MIHVLANVIFPAITYISHESPNYNPRIDWAKKVTVDNMNFSIPLGAGTSLSQGTRPPFCQLTAAIHRCPFKLLSRDWPKTQKQRSRTGLIPADQDPDLKYGRQWREEHVQVPFPPLAGTISR